MSLSPDNDEPTIARTTHAMLVPWGLYARQIGLVQRLEEVPIAQRKRDYAPTYLPLLLALRITNRAVRAKGFCALSP